MTDAGIPVSRPVLVADLPEGEETSIVFSANEAECAALARSLGIPAVAEFTGDFVLTKRPRERIRVEGEARALLTRVCVVTLDLFEVETTEPIDVDFAPPEDAAAAAARIAHEAAPGESIADQPDPPDPIIDGRIDLGAVATEFLALSLDPYPRKPGAAFAAPADAASIEESPFAKLQRLKLDEK